MKCSSAVYGGREIDVYKHPSLASGNLDKSSKRGRLTCYTNGQEYITDRIGNCPRGYYDYMQDVFVNGELVVKTNFSDIRRRVNANAKLNIQETTT